MVSRVPGEERGPRAGFSRKGRGAENNGGGWGLTQELPSHLRVTDVTQVQGTHVARGLARRFGNWNWSIGCGSTWAEEHEGRLVSGCQGRAAQSHSELVSSDTQ